MSTTYGTDSVRPPHEVSARVLIDAKVEAHGQSRMTRPDIAAYRRRLDPMPAGWNPIRASTLRHADDQTIAAVAAVRQTIEGGPDPSPNRFEGWGVVAASRFLGRSNLVLTLDRFRDEGPWGVSPHLIPHFALHSQAGTLSLVLGGHGPNLGVGGGVFAGSDGILTALSWLDSGIVPGVWLVLTGWSPEYLPDLDGEPREPTHCEALALALSPADGVKDDSLRLQMVESGRPVAPVPPTAATFRTRLESPRFSARNTSTIERPCLRLHASRGHETYPSPHLHRDHGRRDRITTVGTDATGRYVYQLESTGPGRDGASS